MTTACPSRPWANIECFHAFPRKMLIFPCELKCESILIKYWIYTKKSKRNSNFVIDKNFQGMAWAEYIINCLWNIHWLTSMLFNVHDTYFWFIFMFAKCELLTAFETIFWKAYLIIIIIIIISSENMTIIQPPFYHSWHSISPFIIIILLD